MIVSLLYSLEVVLFVCGGNTGRSVMASWYANSKYEYIVDAFSRGSGIDPDDDFHPQPNAATLIKDHYGRPDQFKFQRATVAAIQDLNYADIILTMTTEHKNRLLKLVDNECLQSSINMRELSFYSRSQWDKMCLNKQKIKNKIFTLVGCVTGIDGDIPDAFGHDMAFYQQVLQQIKANVDMAVADRIRTSQWCTKYKE